MKSKKSIFSFKDWPERCKMSASSSNLSGFGLQLVPFDWIKLISMKQNKCEILGNINAFFNFVKKSGPRNAKCRPALQTWAGLGFSWWHAAAKCINIKDASGHSRLRQNWYLIRQLEKVKCVIKEKRNKAVLTPKCKTWRTRKNMIYQSYRATILW